MYPMNNKKLVLLIGLVVVVVMVAAVVMDRRSGPIPSSPMVPASSSSTIPTGTPQAGSQGVSISVRSVYTGGSFKFSYPESWSVLNAAPVTVTNFSKYTSDGLIPMGGALISVQTTTVYDGNLEGMIAAQLRGAANMTTSTITVDAISCDSHSFDAAAIESRSTAVYCERGTELWEIYFAYRLGDPSAAAHVADFTSVQGSMRFLP
jgi:hypothetical protein